MLACSQEEDVPGSVRIVLKGVGGAILAGTCVCHLEAHITYGKGTTNPRDQFGVALVDLLLSHITMPACRFLPAGLQILGYARSPMTDEQLRQRLAEYLPGPGKPGHEHVSARLLLHALNLAGAPAVHGGAAQYLMWRHAGMPCRTCQHDTVSLHGPACGAYVAGHGPIMSPAPHPCD